MPQDRPKPFGARQAVVALFVGAAGTAMAAVIVRLSELGPSATAFHRMALAIPMMAAWMWLTERGRPPAAAKLTARDVVLLAATGVFFAGDLIALHWSIGLTTVANAVLFLNSQPIFVALGAWLVFGTRFTRLYLVGLALAMIGAAVLMGNSLQLGADHLLGDALGLASGIFYALYILVTVRLRARFRSLPIMIWTCVAASPLLLIAAVASGEAILPQTLYGWAIVILLAFVAQFAGNGLIVVALAHLPAEFSAVGLLVQPVMAGIFAWIVLGEPLSALAVGGMGIVLAGIWIAHRGSRLPAPPAP